MLFHANEHFTFVAPVALQSTHILFNGYSCLLIKMLEDLKPVFGSDRRGCIENYTLQVTGISYEKVIGGLWTACNGSIEYV